MATAVALAAFVGLQYAPSRTAPFIGDDYLILDKIQHLSFLQVWLPRVLLFSWYRPWSREFHFWAMYRLFGLRVEYWHLVSLALWVAVLTCFFGVARRLTDTRAAAVATAGIAALAAWGAPLTWIAGVQELWMLLFVMLALQLCVAGRTAWAAVPFALALLSKETAAGFPVVAMVWERLAPHASWKRAWRRTAPLWACLLAWASIHPLLLPRLTRPEIGAAERLYRPSEPVVIVKTLLMHLNVEEWPAPTGSPWVAGGWPLAGVVILGALAIWGAWSKPAPDGGRMSRRTFATLAAWAVMGWLPVLVPSIGWHAYYALLGAFAAWLLLAWAVVRWRPAAVALVALVATLLPLRETTPSWDWSSLAYQLRGAHFVKQLRDDLLRLHPAVPPRTRFYFFDVPRNVGFAAGDGQLLRVVYRDSSLSGGFLSTYRPRPPGRPGMDLFFRYDTAGRWVEVVDGPEDVVRSQARDPEWAADQRQLSMLLGANGEWRRAAADIAKLARAYPADPQYPSNLAYCYARLGDEGAAGRWRRAADSLRVRWAGGR
ncbi:MAG TPA: hypothetical protein VFK69_09180 [Candidatus Eisenbacteria bacterium]|nr:hypothetical protein [Candidatus Eisenbacteria bacterium]